jgi:hypothetical protein
MHPTERRFTPPHDGTGEPRSADVAITVVTALILVLVLLFVASM